MLGEFSGSYTHGEAGEENFKAKVRFLSLTQLRRESLPPTSLEEKGEGMGLGTQKRSFCKERGA